MGVPLPEMEPVENASAEALLSSLKTIDPGERRKHASVFNYWLSIRGNRQFPPIRDLDPLEISDAGPWSLLLEMIGGGEDAVVRHFGQAIRDGIEVEKIGDAPSPSLLSCIHSKLPIVAACREAYAFEEDYDADGGRRRCWVTLLPFSANGTWIDFVYGYVSVDGARLEAEVEAEAAVEEAIEVPPEQPEAAYEVEEPADEIVEEPVEATLEETAEEELEPFQVPLGPLDEDIGETEAAAELVQEAVQPEPEPIEEAFEQEREPEPVEDAVEEAFDEPIEEPAAAPVADYAPEPDSKPSFTAKFMASVGGFYARTAQAEPDYPADEPTEPDAVAAEEETAFEPEPEAPVEPIAEPAYPVEGTLQTKLTDVRALAEEARQAQLRSNQALYEGLSAAYDFALDAEAEPEEYLRLVEAQGLKIQLRSPMKPVVRLAFDGYCDEPTIPQLEAVLAWALKNDLPRGTLAERIEAEGGIGQILNSKAA